MTNTFRRRVYRYCVISAASFLVAFLLYDLGDVGVATEQLIFTIIRNQPTISEGTVLAVALSVAGACIFMGHLSSR
jgi:hypothetical protein